MTKSKRIKVLTIIVIFSVLGLLGSALGFCFESTIFLWPFFLTLGITSACSIIVCGSFLLVELI